MLQARDQIGSRADLLHCTDALAAAPDVLPGFGAAITEIHFGRIAFRQVFRVQACRFNGIAQVVAMDAGEQVGIDNVVGAAVYDGLFIAFVGIGFIGSDEGRADVAQVGAHGLGGQH